MNDQPQNQPQEVPLSLANEARRHYLASHGIPVPMDQMYTTSLLEFLLLATGGEGALANARAYHEERIVPILDSAVANLARVEEARATTQARRTLTEGIR